MYNPVLSAKKREILLPILDNVIKFLSVESKKPLNIKDIYNNELCQKVSSKCKGKCTKRSNQTLNRNRGRKHNYQRIKM